jgi:hypothetical protein
MLERYHVYPPFSYDDPNATYLTCVLYVDCPLPKVERKEPV